jgi:hypothetical protein
MQQSISMPSSWRVTRLGHRLVELVLTPPLGVADVGDTVAAIGVEVRRGAPTPVVFAADIRALQVMPPEVAEKFLAMLRSNSPAVERTAVLIPIERGVLALQVERLIHSGGHANRRTFDNPQEAIAWLQEVTPDATLLAARWGVR